MNNFGLMNLDDGYLDPRAQFVQRDAIQELVIATRSYSAIPKVLALHYPSNFTRNIGTRIPLTIYVRFERVNGDIEMLCVLVVLVWDLQDVSLIQIIYAINRGLAYVV